MRTIKRIVVTYAIKEELIHLRAPDCEFFYLFTGVGKAKSAFELTRYLSTHEVDLVLNIGTAGTFNHKVGGIWLANQLVDRDYEAIRLPGIEYEMNGEDLLQQQPLLQSWMQTFDNKGLCSTGDSFVMDTARPLGDVVDMEAYAQAYVCQQMNIPFLAVKYITDRIGQNSVALWESRLHTACIALGLWFDAGRFPFQAVQVCVQSAV